MSIQKLIDDLLDDEIEVEYYDGEVTLELIRKFEKKLGYSLPQDFVEFSLLKQFPLAIMVNEEIWPDPECGDIGPAWTSMKGFFCNNFSDSIHEDFCIQELYTDYAEDKAVPFLSLQADSSSFCFMPDNKIHLRDRSGYESYDSDLGFTAFLEEQLKELMNRKTQYKEWKAGKRKYYEPLS